MTKITSRTAWRINSTVPDNSTPTHTLTHTRPFDSIRAQDGATVNFYAMWRNHRGRIVHIVRMVIFITDIRHFSEYNRALDSPGCGGPAVNDYLEARDTSYPIDPAGTYTRACRGRLAKSVRCRGASSRLVDQPWRLMSIRIWQWALWVLIGESWYYSPRGATAPKIDLADADEDAGASVPNVAVGGVNGPVAEMASTAASADSGAGSDTATDDDDGDAAPADIYFFTAVGSSSAREVGHREVVRRAEIHRRAGRVGAGEEIVDHPDAFVPSSVSALEIYDRFHRHGRAEASLSKAAPRRSRASSSGAPTGYYYYTGGAATYIENPAGAYSPAGPSAGLAALNPHGAPAGYYYKAGAAAYIEDPAGTYSPAGASAPIADPGGTYSAAGASAPTTDPAGTYSSPYALTRLFLDPNPTTPATGVLSFNSATAVANYYGATSFEASLANEFFAGYGGAPATMLFTRYSGGGGRPHLYGANISNLTLKYLQSISGSLSIDFQGSTWPEPITYSASINLFGVHSFSAAAETIQSALNSNLPPVAVTSESSIAPISVSFTGSVIGDLLQITSVSSGTIELGAEISGLGIPAGAQIVTQRSGTPGGPGLYTLFAKAGTVSSETMTETYGVLTVGSATGPVAVGQKVTGAGVLPMTAIDGPGPLPGTWLVNNAQTVGGPGGESMTMAATPLVVNYNSFGGATSERNFFEIQPNGQFGYDYNPSTLSFASGTVADELGLTDASNALDSSPGGAWQSASVYMNNLVQNEMSQFGSYQATWQTLAELDPGYLGDLAEWAQSTGDLYTFLNQWTNTTPAAGSSLPMTDPAGTYSGPGASAPTLAQPGYYVPTAGASSETPDDPGYYTPLPGATAEILALPPTISGTAAGQSASPLQPDTPFASAVIADPNFDTSDSLSIRLTGAGGTLTDGAGFNGLTSSGPGVDLLSGIAAAITSELEALIFTPGAGFGTTTFTLTDTSSVGTRASDANTTVIAFA